MFAQRKRLTALTAISALFLSLVAMPFASAKTDVVELAFSASEPIITEAHGPEVTLSWNDLTDFPFVGKGEGITVEYTVVRYSTMGEVVVVFSGVNQTSFKDTSADFGGTYYYMNTAILDYYGMRMQLDSQYVKVVTPKKQLYYVDLDATSGVSFENGAEVKLSWTSDVNPTTAKAVDGVRVEYSVTRIDENGQSKLVYIGSKTHVVDTSVAFNKDYIYVVNMTTATEPKLHLGQSDAVSVTILSTLIDRRS